MSRQLRAASQGIEVRTGGEDAGDAGWIRKEEAQFQGDLHGEGGCRFNLDPIEPMGVADAISRARSNEDREFAETRWSDALSSSGPRRGWAGVRLGNRLVDHRQRHVAATEDEAFTPIMQIGGARGWYFANWLWVPRGWLDLLLGGVGMRRGRRDPDNLQPGDALDFWRVKDVKQPNLLRLRAEMKLPGRAWLQWEVESAEPGHAVITRRQLMI